MGEEYKKYQNLAMLISQCEDIVDIYKDQSDGEYLLFRNSDNKKFKSVDNIETDGFYEFSDDVYTVNGSTYVLIKTYVEGDKVTEPKLSKISIILSYAGLGLLESAFLNFSDFSNFYKLSSGEAYVKGNINDFNFVKNEIGFSIIPSNEETKREFDKLYNKKQNSKLVRERV